MLMERAEMLARLFLHRCVSTHYQSFGCRRLRHSNMIDEHACVRIISTPCCADLLIWLAMILALEQASLVHERWLTRCMCLLHRLVDRVVGADLVAIRQCRFI